MAEEDRMTPEQHVGREAAGTSPEARTDRPIDHWIVFRGRLENRLRLGEVKRGGKLVDYVKATAFVDQEGLPPVLSRIEIPHGEKGIVLKLDSRHPKSSSRKEVGAAQWLEQMAVASAKLDFLSRADNVPYPIREEAKRQTRPFTNSANEALRLVQKEGRESFTRADIKRIFPEGSDKRKAVVGGLKGAVLTVFLAACGSLNVVGPGIGIEQTQVPGSIATEVWTPGLSETPSSTATPEVTNTPEPTATPEIVAADPGNIESWPDWAQDFFVNHPEDASQDARFQEFLNLSRRQHLRTVGVSGVEQMSSQELMRYMIKQAAIEQQPVLLAPAEIIRLITDHGEWMRPHIDPANGAWYDLWDNFHIVTDVRIAPTPPIDEDSFQTYMNISYPSTVFGRDTEIPVLTADEMRLDLAGVVRLPGQGERSGLLMRYVDANGGMHYRVYRALDEATTFGGESFCLAGGDGLSNFRNCPYPIEGGGIRIGDPTPETIDNLERAPRHPVSDLLPYLNWAPSSTVLHLLSSPHSYPVATFGVIDPDTGLLVADYIYVYTPEEFPTSPDY